MKNLNIIVAYSIRHRVIGKDGTIPWKLPEDMKRFKELTTGHTCVMGRKTFESIGKPLPKRQNIIVSKTLENVKGCVVASSLDDAVAKSKNDTIFVIGGSSLYREALTHPLTQKLYLTVIDDVYEGDAFFPEIEWSKWEIYEYEYKAGYRFLNCCPRREL